MNCRECKEKLEGLLEGQGMPKISAELKAHISGCKECETQYRAIAAFKRSMSGEKTRVPADFNAGVWKKIGQPSPSLFDRILGLRITPAYALQAAVTAAAFIFLIVMVEKSYVKNELSGPIARIVKTGDKVAVKPKAQSPNNTVKKSGNKPEPVEVARVQVTPEPAAEQYIEPVKVANVDEGPGKGPVKEKNPQTIYMANPATQPPVTSNQQAVQDKVSAANISKTPGINIEKLVKPVTIGSNVFNPGMGQALTLKYEVKKSTMVTIIVFNLKGEPVAHLVNRKTEPGIYEEKWAGVDDNKAPLPAGKYLVYIKTDLTEQKIKAAIVK